MSIFLPFPRLEVDILSRIWDILTEEERRNRKIILDAQTKRVLPTKWLASPYLKVCKLSQDRVKRLNPDVLEVYHIGYRSTEFCEECRDEKKRRSAEELSHEYPEYLGYHKGRLYINLARETVIATPRLPIRPETGIWGRPWVDAMNIARRGLLREHVAEGGEPQKLRDTNHFLGEPSYWERPLHYIATALSEQQVAAITQLGACDWGNGSILPRQDEYIGFEYVTMYRLTRTFQQAYFFVALSASATDKRFCGLMQHLMKQDCVSKVKWVRSEGEGAQ